MAYARITRDELHALDPDAFPVNREGEIVVNQPPHEASHVKVRLLDDDRIVYYEATSDDSGMEPLFDWAQRDSGTTILQQWNRKTKKWEDVIG